MRCADILNILEERCPKAYALDWDNCGLQTGRYDKEVNTIYIALDATDEVIAAAAAQHAELLITHHPLLFNGIKQIHDQDFIGRRLLTLIQADMCCYAMHTNYDVACMGELSARLLHLNNARVLEVTSEDEKGIGQYGSLDTAIPLSTLAEQLKQIFEQKGIPVWVDLWGHDVKHDWDWWYKQAVYYMPYILE